MGVKWPSEERPPHADAAPPAQSVVPSSAIRRDGERSVVFVLQGRPASSAGR